MKRSNIIPILFGAVGAVLAVTVLLVCLLARDASPKLVSEPTSAKLCTQGFLGRLSAGDYVGASVYLYGNPKLDGRTEQTNELTGPIWDAFVRSIHCEVLTDCAADVSGVTQQVRIRSLNIPSVTSRLKARAEYLLEQRVDGAAELSDIYDEDYNYREDFVSQVLQDATDLTVEQDGQMMETDVTLKLVFEDNRWWIVPDQALIAAISGGLVG